MEAFERRDAEIVRRIKAGERPKEMCEDYGLARSSVYAIAYRRGVSNIHRKPRS